MAYPARKSRTDSRGFYEALSRGELAPVYWLSGENAHERGEALKKITEAVNPGDFNRDVFYGDRDGASAIVQAACAAPVFAERRLVVVRRADALNSDGCAALAEYLQNPADTTCLVLVAEGVSESVMRKGRAGLLALSKAASAAGTACEFSFPTEQSAHMWIADFARKQGLSVPFDAARAMTECAGTDLQVLENEILKLAAWKSGSKSREVTTAEVLDSMGFERDLNPFALSDALSSRNGPMAVRIVGKLLAEGGEPAALLAMVSKYAGRLIKARRMINAGMAQSQIAAEMGVSPFYVRRLESESRLYPDERALLNALRKILEADAAIKTSSGDAAIHLKSAVLALTGTGIRL